VAIGCSVFRSRDIERLCQALRGTADKKSKPSKTNEGMPLTSAELKSTSELLRDYEGGKVDLYPIAEAKLGELLMGYYLAKTNEIANKAKLPISRSFALAGRYEEAIQLADEYVRVVPNDVRGWRIIGLASYELEKYARACEALTNAVALGETNVSTVLAMCAFESGQVGIVKEIVPQLLQSARFGDDPIAARVALLVYAICSDDQDLFVQALDGVELTQGSKASQIRAMLLVGHLRFQQSPQVQSLWMKYQATLQ
jgi:tetratricopeptide (TPR) repeat protein